MTHHNIRKIKPFQTIATQDTPVHISEIQVTPDQVDRSLADRKYELSRMKDQLELELAQIDAELKQQLHDGEIVATQHGVGYKLTVANHEVYDRRVIAELSRMRLLPKFVRVSTTKLKELVSEGKLSRQKFNSLREYATSKEITTLREVPLIESHAS